MEVMQVLHMNKGAGDTSYANNSSLQSKIISTAKPVIEEAVIKILNTNFPDSMGIADLGCSSGPNSLRVISEIMELVYAKCCSLGRPTPEFKVSLNDLFSNDFNDIFASLPGFYNKLKEEKGDGFGPCFISGVAGSFYGRLFPSKSMHFVHSSSSLHWLSQLVPPSLDSSARTSFNKGKIYISKSSPKWVLETYYEQFQKDFSVFLKSRSEEIMSGGRMVLFFMGRSSMDPTTEESCSHWELLAQALMSMVLEGLIAEEKLDSFNIPYYAPCIEEVKLEIQKEGSFIIDRLEALEIDGDEGGGSDTLETLSRGQREAKTIRAVMESMLEHHFGYDMMDDLFRRYADRMDDYMSWSRDYYINLVVSVTRNEH